MIEFLLYTIFFASAFLLILVILLQEGKGGGLSDAFGGAGAATFGVRSGGINRFTFGLFFVFLFSALALHWTNDSDVGSVMNEDLNAAGLGTPEIPLQNN
ncbi:MAG: preprotein translocase subunit SecG [Planctomycetota bacterium]|jgi:preprotein translocase subunit SecG|nr:preprotein translocase subunit SecG [Planctomycetota bacterium]